MRQQNNNRRPWGYMRHRGVRLGLIHPGPMMTRPQMMVKRDGVWTVLPYGVIE